MQQRQYVAIDLHRWRSVIVREDKEGGELGVTRIDNSALALSQAMSEAGPCPQVAIEATAGWYWAVDVLQELGAEVHLVNPSGLAWGDRRVEERLPGLLRPHRGDAPRQAPGGLDRSAGDSGAAGAGVLPSQADADGTSLEAHVKAVVAIRTSLQLDGASL